MSWLNVLKRCHKCKNNIQTIPLEDQTKEILGVLHQLGVINPWAKRMASYRSACYHAEKLNQAVSSLQINFMETWDTKATEYRDAYGV
jgi:hypothetical protein